MKRREFFKTIGTFGGLLCLTPIIKAVESNELIAVPVAHPVVVPKGQPVRAYWNHLLERNGKKEILLTDYEYAACKENRFEYKIHGSAIEKLRDRKYSNRREYLEVWINGKPIECVVEADYNNKYIILANKCRVDGDVQIFWKDKPYKT